MDAEQLVGLLLDEIEGKLPLPIRGSVVVASFSAMVGDVMAGTNISTRERARFEAQVKLFIHCFGEVVRIQQDELREAAFVALKSALFVSAYYAGGPEAWRRLDRARTESARAARKRDDIQEIVAREAKGLWKRKPSFKGNSGGTANEICDAVAAAIGALPIQPTGWETAGLSDPEKRQKFIEAIRKRVSRLK